ncbi:hypothetical protein BHM03_00006816 [Ensete ventricosum]|nr:hypothetical protein BHM03_00006816 [Ensete ventricosum]
MNVLQFCCGGPLFQLTKLWRKWDPKEIRQVVLGVEKVSAREELAEINKPLPMAFRTHGSSRGVRCDATAHLKPRGRWSHPRLHVRSEIIALHHGR